MEVSGKFDDKRLEDEIQQQLRNEWRYSLRICALIRRPNTLFLPAIADFVRYTFRGQNEGHPKEKEVGDIRKPYQSTLYSKLSDRIHKRIQNVVESRKHRDLVSSMTWSPNATSRATKIRLSSLQPMWKESTSRNTITEKYKKQRLRGQRWDEVSTKLSYGCLILAGGPLCSRVYGPPQLLDYAPSMLTRCSENWAYPWMKTDDLVEYICHYYPEAVRIFNLLDPFVRCLLSEAPPPEIDSDDIANRIEAFLTQ